MCNELRFLIAYVSRYFFSLFLFSIFTVSTSFAVGPNNLGPNKFAPNKIIQPYFDYTFIADDNILRARDQLIKNPSSLPPSQFRDELTKNNLSDFSNRFVGGVLLNKEISRQRFSADLSWAYNKFERFSFMDNDFKRAIGNWDWTLGNRLQGNMGVTYQESLMPMLFQPGTKVIRSEQTQFINAVWSIHPRWNLNAEYMRYTLDTGKNPRAANLDRTENRFEGGIDYVTPSKNTIGVLFRYIMGDFSRAASTDRFTGEPLSSNYDQKEVMAKINWAVTEKSRFIVTGGWVERTNASLTQRNFSGFNARGTYTWNPTEKLGVTVNGWRLTSSMQNLTTNFSINTGVSAIPHWQITNKIRLEGDFSYETRNFDRFTGFFDNAALIGTNNTFRNATFRAVYIPHPTLQLSASIYHADLKSNAVFGGFNANGVTANLHYVYGKQ
ncbi:MAG TPA: outer membrane beta-barrel protein [Nitrosomonas sp.]|nr:outer membrane beta-barrel protein [Nitrosomonas sp.]HQX13097.1 outer membrane beta-barrel protein [Nitrosomonas sp.]HRB32713.1 outer membrane beta-barrel protein [Nitrosomonas sp.]HRB45112.1 outer membrane beta-barrel protein [Nitrosomonas sp.]HRB77347.1 outer membrane beta-barrel protein [Nitrosomonas sp.]